MRCYIESLHKFSWRLPLFVLLVVFSHITFVTLAMSNCSDKNKTKVLIRTYGWEMVLYRYERRTDLPNVEQLPKEGLWSNMSLGIWNYYYGDLALADSFIMRDLRLIEKYGEVQDEHDFGGTKSIDYLLLGMSALKQSKFDESRE